MPALTGNASSYRTCSPGMEYDPTRLYHTLNPEAGLGPAPAAVAGYRFNWGPPQVQKCEFWDLDRKQRGTPERVRCIHSHRPPNRSHTGKTLPLSEAHFQILP
jgi:hypothetical protein